MAMREKRTCIVFHADSDGAAAAAMVYSRLLAENSSVSSGGVAGHHHQSVSLVPVLSAESVGKVIRSSSSLCNTSDDVFILDLGAVSQEDVDYFIEESAVVVIDHHAVPAGVPLRNCIHENPRLNGLPAKPVSLLVYDMLGRPDGFDWVAAVGVVGDWCASMDPELLELVRTDYPGFATHSSQEELYFNDQVGAIARGIDAVKSVEGASGMISVVEALARNAAAGPNAFLNGCKEVTDSLKAIEAIVGRLKPLARTEETGGGRIVVLVIPENDAAFEVKRELVQLLSFENPESNVVVVIQEGSDGSASFSLRQGKACARRIDLNVLARNAIKGFPGAGGGGHPEASGGGLRFADVPEFLRRVRLEVESGNK